MELETATQRAYRPRIDRDGRLYLHPDRSTTAGKLERQRVTEARTKVIREHLATIRIDATRPSNVSLNRAVFEQIGNGLLEQMIALPIDHPPNRGKTFDDWRGCCDETDTHAGREYFGECAEIHDDAVHVRAR